MGRRRDKLEKVAIFQESLAIPDREARVPRVGGQSTKHLADVIRRKFGTRAPQLTERMLAAVDAMGRVNPDAVDVPLAKTTPDPQFPRIKNKPNPKYKIMFDPNQGSFAGDTADKRHIIHLDSTRPATAGHEMGHVVDSQRGMDFGNRGFFGFGGDAKSQVPSEVSATRHAVGVGAGGPTDLADLTGATGTYMQSTLPNTQRRQQTAYSEALLRGDRPLAESLVAANKKNDVYRARVEDLRKRGGDYDFWKATADQVTKEREPIWNRQMDALRKRRSRARWGTPDYEAVDRILQNHYKVPHHFYGTSPEMRPFLSPELQRKFDLRRMAQNFQELLSKRDIRLEEVARRATNPATNRTVLHNLSPGGARTLTRLSKGLGNRLDRMVGPGLGQAAGRLAEDRLMSAPAFTPRLPVRPGGLPIVPKLTGALRGIPKLGSAAVQDMKKAVSQMPKPSPAAEMRQVQKRMLKLKPKVKYAASEHLDHFVELAGLGILAKPSIDELRGKKVDEKTKARWEVAGLGALGAPSAYKLGKHLYPKIKSYVR